MLNILTMPNLTYFDPQKSTLVPTDASSFGLGAVSQQDIDGVMKPVDFDSRTLNATEHYVQIKIEVLAVMWACEKFHDYLIGLHLTVETDHKPLASLLAVKPLNDLSPHIQKMRIVINVV